VPGIRYRRSLILLAPALVACYVPAPADLTTIAPGQDLRIVVSPGGRDRPSGTSAGVAEELRGRLLGLTADSLTIATRLRVPTYGGSATQTLRQAFTFGRADIQQVTVPRLDRRRTALVVGSVLVAAVIVFADLFDIRGDGGGGGPPDPPPDPSPFWSRR